MTNFTNTSLEFIKSWRYRYLWLKLRLFVLFTVVLLNHNDAWKKTLCQIDNFNSHPGRMHYLLEGVHILIKLCVQCCMYALGYCAGVVLES